MEQLQGWGASLCFVAAACAVLQFLAPKTSAGRLFEMLCGAVLVFCMLRPLVKVDWRSVLNLDGFSQPISQKTQMQLYIQERLYGPLQEAVNTEGAAILEQYGFSAERIAATMDIDESGNIVIHEVVVYLNAEQIGQRVSIQKVLEQRFETAVTVKEA